MCVIKFKNLYVLKGGSMKIIRNLVIAMASALMVIGVSALKVQAAPVKMADGTMFDAAYYASAYPDVAAVFGTNPDLLYMHYQLCGKAEGRLAVAPSSAAPALATGMLHIMLRNIPMLHRFSDMIPQFLSFTTISTARQREDSPMLQLRTQQAQLPLPHL